MELIDVWRIICERVNVDRYLSVQHAGAGSVEDGNPGSSPHSPGADPACSRLDVRFVLVSAPSCTASLSFERGCRHMSHFPGLT